VGGRNRAEKRQFPTGEGPLSLARVSFSAKQRSPQEQLLQPGSAKKPSGNSADKFHCASLGSGRLTPICFPPAMLCLDLGMAAQRETRHPPPQERRSRGTGRDNRLLEPAVTFCTYARWVQKAARVTSQSNEW